VIRHFPRENRKNKVIQGILLEIYVARMARNGIRGFISGSFPLLPALLLAK
jgi:hypothetical protein